MSFTKLKDKINFNKLYSLFNILKLEMFKFMYVQYNNFLPKIFAYYFSLVSKSYSCNTQNASKKFFTFLKCSLLKDSYHINI